MGGFDTPGDARAVDIMAVGSSLYAFVADGANGVQAWDVTNPAAPRFLGSRDDGTAQSVTVQGEKAFVSDPSGLHVVLVRSVPAILQQPKAAVQNIGLGVEFSVTADGAPTLRYQWKKNGLNIAGATSSSYLINAVGTPDAGYYQVEVANDYTITDEDKALSTAAGLTVRALPRLDLSGGGVGRYDCSKVSVKRAFVFNVGSSGDLEELGALEPDGDSEALGLNDYGQVVATAKRGGKSRAMLALGGGSST